jgi:hypothetical protein
MIRYERFSFEKEIDGRICAGFKFTNKNMLTASMDWKIHVYSLAALIESNHTSRLSSAVSTV